MGSGELTIKKSPSRKVVIWLYFELDLARTKLTGGSPGGQRPDRGATAVHEEAQGVPGSWSLIEALHGPISADQSS